MDKWSAPYRGWHYQPDYVIPAQPKVPGHEKFVRQMVAGATGIDVVMLVVAADDGVMPQTREHLAIIDLLGISEGVVALTKSDLADEDWIELVRGDAGFVFTVPIISADFVRVVDAASVDVPVRTGPPLTSPVPLAR